MRLAGSRSAPAPLHRLFRYRPCYASCAAVNPTGDCGYLEDGCDWTACYDDVSYTQAVLYHVLDTFCVDTDRLHVTGVGNGGMFIWSKLMDRMAATLASAGESAVHGGSGLGHLLIIRNCGKLSGPRL